MVELWTSKKAHYRSTRDAGSRTPACEWKLREFYKDARCAPCTTSVFFLCDTSGKMSQFMSPESTKNTVPLRVDRLERLKAMLNKQNMLFRQHIQRRGVEPRTRELDYLRKKAAGKTGPRKKAGHTRQIRTRGVEPRVASETFGRLGYEKTRCALCTTSVFFEHSRVRWESKEPNEGYELVISRGKNVTTGITGFGRGESNPGLRVKPSGYWLMRRLADPGEGWASKEPNERVRSCCVSRGKNVTTGITEFGRGESNPGLRVKPSGDWVMRRLDVRCAPRPYSSNTVG
ncbi:hypothetical protein C8R47DRAFT_1063001 [Mycena vitilis]|nr:hypothetical protein C8R47DRAFT_1063001 [Mycena vitilis]